MKEVFISRGYERTYENGKMIMKRKIEAIRNSPVANPVQKQEVLDLEEVFGDEDSE